MAVILASVALMDKDGAQPIVSLIAEILLSVWIDGIALIV